MRPCIHNRRRASDVGAAHSSDGEQGPAQANGDGTPSQVNTACRADLMAVGERLALM